VIYLQSPQTLETLVPYSANSRGDAGMSPSASKMFRKGERTMGRSKKTRRLAGSWKESQSLLHSPFPTPAMQV
jgi:hypothetical protein